MTGDTKKQLTGLITTKMPNLIETEINYGLDPVEVIIRIEPKQVGEFNQLNSISIDQIRDQLKGIEKECLFQKTSEEEHRLFIPLKEGYLEAHVREHDLSGTYEVVLKKTLKTSYQENLILPDVDKLIENCTVRIIDIDEGGRENRPSAEFEALQDKVSRLNIASTVNIGNQQDIWFKYIEAQKAILHDLEKPYKVKGKPRIREVINKKDKVDKYEVQFDLAHEFLPEFRQVEKKMKDLGLDVEIDVDGNLQLTREEIRTLDVVIEREFPEQIERSSYIGAILMIKSKTLAKKIQARLLDKIAVRQDTYNKRMILSCMANNFIHKKLRKERFEFSTYRARFRIINHGDILENKGINEQYRITFGRGPGKSHDEVERIFPYPEENTFHLEGRDPFKFRLFYKALIPIYGKENIESSIETEYEMISGSRVEFYKDYPEDFWTKLKRQLYLINLDESLNIFSKSFFLEFRDEKELEEQYLAIKDLEDCEVTYSPLEEDFRFKVKINVIAKKTERELFLEKLKRLRGAEFVVEVGEEGKRRPSLQYLGKLNGYESDLEKISLYLPNYFQPDQKKAKKATKFLKTDESSDIRFVRANLTGDTTKIGWLQDAIQKITKPTNAPNGRPVNDNLGEFIFDTSKAKRIYDEEKLREDSEHYREVVENQLLTLNKSQLKAVIAAVNCSDLALLQGPPGTGKTTIIAEMIWQMIRKDPKHRILLTSETNLAVDNALDRLLNEKSVNPKLVGNMTLLKPLRFGRMSKMDEEGAKYSAERIHQWINPEFKKEPEEVTTLDEEVDDSEEKNLEGGPENNAVLDWMKRIASRAKNSDQKYAEALKDWALDLSFPSLPIKKLFADKYFEYANIVGSTCSSAGSPRFMWDFAETILRQDVESQRKLNYHAQFAPFGKGFEAAISSLDLPPEVIKDFRRLIQLYQNERRLVQKKFGKDESNWNHDDDFNFRSLMTVDGRQPQHAKDTDRLLSYQTLTEFGKTHIAPFFQPKVYFDTVIMDEASKATPPELLLPLCFGKRSVVIGDHRQLPPMLNEKDFREALMDAGAGKLADEIDREFTETSQFERMIRNPNVSKTIISRCNIQYRMHPDINSVIKQFYQDEDEKGLEPADQIIENADDSDLSNVFSRYHGLYSEGLVDPNTHTIWVDVKSPESKEGTSAMNHGEVKAVRKVLQMLKQADGFQEFQDHWKFIEDDFKRLQEQQIGVISFYGAQKRLLKKSLAGIGLPLKINTVDRFQGMERNILIVSTVRSHQKITFGKKVEPNKDSGFAKSPQRLNVALSRARRLLIVVGNKDFFSAVKDSKGNPLYKNAIAEIEKSGRIIDEKSLQAESI